MDVASFAYRKGSTLSNRNRRLREHLRDKDPVGAARCAKEIGRLDLALCIYRRRGDRAGMAEVMVRKGDVPGAIDVHIKAGWERSAMNLAFKHLEFGNLDGIVDSAMRFSGNLDSSPILVGLLLKAQRAVQLQHFGLGLLGLHDNGFAQSLVKKRGLEAKARRYGLLALEVGQRGIDYFKRVGSFYEAVLIGLKLNDYPAAIGLVREGLDRGCCHNGFLRTAGDVMAKAQKEEMIPDGLALMARIERHRELREHGRNGNGGPRVMTPKEIVRFRGRTLASVT